MCINHLGLPMLIIIDYTAGMNSPCSDKSK